jgi:hypothetical protein
MIVKDSLNKLSFVARNSDGSVVTGTPLTALYRIDKGEWKTALNSPFESSSSQAPGLYDLQLLEAESSGNEIEIYVKKSSGHDLVYHESFEVSEFASSAQATFDAVYNFASLSAEQKSLLDSYFASAADGVLLRTQSDVEQGSAGSAATINSLLGVVSLMTQGQTVTGPDCNGQYWVYANSAVSGSENLGSLQFVYNDSGSVISVLPSSGPNSVEQAGGGCSVPVTNPSTIPGTFLSSGGCNA